MGATINITPCRNHREVSYYCQKCLNEAVNKAVSTELLRLTKNLAKYGDGTNVRLNYESVVPVSVILNRIADLASRPVPLSDAIRR